MRSLHSATKSSPRLLQLEKARTQQRRPNAAKNKKWTGENKKKKNQGRQILWRHVSDNLLFKKKQLEFRGKMEIWKTESEGSLPV